ncbi:hypothetical protein M3Y96_01035000 [Aphelenchoides besseyi]|nr:hypothetical protein M3Y96_01035000 [Aphelenchoides besseyi]
MVKVIRETYKNAKIVYYDIGLTAEEEALQEWPSFFYIDSSVRIREPILHRMVDAVKNGSQPSILSFNGTRHSIFATAYPTTYKYLPISRLLASAYEEIAGTPFAY